MKVKTVTRGNTAEIRLNGALTLGNPVENLNHAVKALLHQGISDIVVDLSRVPYADASGLGSLVAVRAGAQSLGRTLTVAGAAGKMRELLQMTGLECLRRRGGSKAVREFSFAKLAIRVA
ncbi:MAG: STAS domain-containing protein [Acidobacteria bacterium]|nr:STAS domain-containing protein [Acidobacteriota bacterium]